MLKRARNRYGVRPTPMARVSLGEHSSSRSVNWTVANNQNPWRFHKASQQLALDLSTNGAIDEINSLGHVLNSSDCIDSSWSFTQLMQVYDKEERQKVLYPTQLKMVEN